MLNEADHLDGRDLFRARRGRLGSDDSSKNESSKTSTSATSSGDGQSTKLPQASEPVDLDPADFTTEIDNPYWPMQPGSRWVYRGIEGGERPARRGDRHRRTKEVDGVTARVVRDVVTDGRASRSR